MRFGTLRSIAHNLGDSISTGLGLPIGFYGYDIFDEARNSSQGFIEIDFINGVMQGAMPSPVLSDALLQYARWFQVLAAKHGATIDDFTQLTLRFADADAYGRHFVATIADQRGRSDSTVYDGMGGLTLAQARPE
jgi:hypothetical protein